METPDRADVVTTYAEYYKIVDGYFAGHFGLLIIVGRPGKSKSYEFQKRAEKKGSKYIRGLGSVYRLYRSLFDHQDNDVILDDAEFYWKKDEGRILLRELTEMKKPASVSWEKANKQLEADGYPNKFKTSSRVCLICNTLKFGRADEFAAIVDRGHLVYFDPPSAEVHAMAATWAPQAFGAEIYEAVGEVVKYIPDLSVRIYERLHQAKQAGRDWRKLLTTYLVGGDDKMLIDLEGVHGLAPAERVRTWCELTGKCRATYFNRRKVLMSIEQDEDAEGENA